MTYYNIIGHINRNNPYFMYYHESKVEATDSDTNHVG